MMRIKRSSERCHIDHGWLQSAHTFSFGHYYDPNNVGYRSLLVLNEDRIEKQSAFEKHGHRDTEIISYILAGEIHHRDTLGSDSVAKAGDVQVLSAGAGLLHSEGNETDSLAHFLQFWLVPEVAGASPRYLKQHFSTDQKLNKLCLILSPDGDSGSLEVKLDARVYASVLEPGMVVTFKPGNNRFVWVQVIRGKITVNGVELTSGDACSAEQEEELRINTESSSEFLLFDLG